MKKNLKTAFFQHILERKKSTHPIFGAWSPLLVHVWFTPSQGPKGFLKYMSFRNETMKIMKCTSLQACTREPIVMASRKYVKLHVPELFQAVPKKFLDIVGQHPSDSKVEGAKTNTPSKTNTYKCLPIANTLLPRTVPGGVGVSRPTEWRFQVPLVVPPHSGLYYLHVGQVTGSTLSHVGSRRD